MKIIKISEDSLESRKQDIINYYSKNINQNPKLDIKILKMLEEFKDDDWEISILYEDLKEKLLITQVYQLETSSCETTYDFGGTIVKLWIITGGTPALALEDYSLTQRFPIVSKWSNENWLKEENRYKHQNPNAIQGPTYDVLPNGKQDIIDYALTNFPKAQTRQTRYNSLPIKGNIKGKKSLDKATKSYSQPSLTLNPYYFNVNVPKPENYHPWWSKILAFCNTHSKLNHLNSGSYEKLSEAEFKELVNLLNEGVSKGIIQQ
jgi:hypothetical protein